MRVQSVFRCLFVIIISCVQTSLFAMDGSGQTPAATSTNSGGLTLGVKLDDEGAQPSQQSSRVETKIHATVNGSAIKIENSGYVAANEHNIYYIGTGQLKSNLVSSTPGTYGCRSLKDEYDDEYDNAFTEGFKPLSGRGLPKKISGSGANDAAVKGGGIGLSKKAPKKMGSNNKQQPAQRGPNVAGDVRHTGNRRQVHLLSIGIGIPLKIIIPGLALMVAVGWLIQKWHDTPAVVEDEIKTGQEVE